MTTVPTAVAAINAGARTLYASSRVRLLSATVSGVLLAVTVLVCVQVRTDLRRSRFWIEMAQGQLQQAQRDLARARSDRATVLMMRNRRSMAAELPMILRKMPAAVPTRQIIATTDVWRIVPQQETGAGDAEDIVFPRTPAEEQSDAAHVGE